MSTLAAPFDIDQKEGDEIRIQAAAVLNYRGGAAAVVYGVGFATPLVPATVSHRFIGVYLETNDNSSGVAGTIAHGAPGDKKSSFVRIKRRGMFAFTQTGLTQTAVGKKAYFSDDQTVVLTPGTTYAGDIVTIDEANSKAWVDIEPAIQNFSPSLTKLVLTAAGTALSNTTTETALATQTIQANLLKAGDRIRIKYQGIATATNSTDTLAIKLYIGGLSGTVLVSEAATDVANNDVFLGEYELVIRTSGASGTVVGFGEYKSIPAAEGTMTIKDDILASTAIDTTAAQVVAVSGTWSVANAGNSCRLDILSVDIIQS